MHSFEITFWDIMPFQDNSLSPNEELEVPLVNSQDRTGVFLVPTLTLNTGKLFLGRI